MKIILLQGFYHPKCPHCRILHLAFWGLSSKAIWFAVIWLCLVCLRSWCNYKRVCIALTYPQPLSVTDIKDITFVGRIAMVILKKKPALSKSQFNAVGIHEQARRCLQCGSVIFYYNAEPHKFRSAWITTISIEWQVTANRGMSLATREQKDVTTDFALCRAFWYFWATKVHDRATTRRIKDNWLRVKRTLEYDISVRK